MAESLSAHFGNVQLFRTHPINLHPFALRIERHLEILEEPVPAEKSGDGEVVTKATPYFEDVSRDVQSNSMEVDGGSAGA